MKFICYLIINNINGRCYVGQTRKKIQERFAQHCHQKKYPVSKAIRKYGKENFSITEISAHETVEETSEAEIGWIEYFKFIGVNLYNIAPGGIHNGPGLFGDEHPMFGKKHSKETRERMKASHADVNGSNNPFHNKKHSEESRKKMSEAKLKNPTRYWLGKKR